VKKEFVSDDLLILIQNRIPSQENLFFTHKLLSHHPVEHVFLREI
jgi:hypothetical protein